MSCSPGVKTLLYVNLGHHPTQPPFAVAFLRSRACQSHIPDTFHCDSARTYSPCCRSAAHWVGGSPPDTSTGVSGRTDTQAPAIRQSYGAPRGLVPAQLQALKPQCCTLKAGLYAVPDRCRYLASLIVAFIYSPLMGRRQGGLRCCTCGEPESCGECE